MEETKANRHSEADKWHQLQSEFMQLANEEKVTPRAVREVRYTHPQEEAYLYAIGNYAEGRKDFRKSRKSGQARSRLLKVSESGHWVLHGGGNENLKARFRALTTRAAIALGAPQGIVPEYFWLHRLYHDWPKNHTGHLLETSAGGVTVLRVCEKSATFCSWLEKQALEQQVMASQGQGIPDVSGQQRGPTSQLGKEVSHSSRVTKRAPQPVELGPGGLKFVVQGDHTVALPCESLGGSDNVTISGVKASYGVLSMELSKVMTIVKANKGQFSGADLCKQFRNSPLAGVADQSDWDSWVEDFAPTNSQRGRPKGAALTFLERKTTLGRKTIKSYLSRAKKIPK